MLKQAAQKYRAPRRRRGQSLVLIAPVVIVVTVTLQPEIITLSPLMPQLVLPLIVLPLISQPPFSQQILTPLVLALLSLTQVELYSHVTPCKS